MSNFIETSSAKIYINLQTDNIVLYEFFFQGGTCKNIVNRQLVELAKKLFLRLVWKVWKHSTTYQYASIYWYIHVHVCMAKH